MWQPEPFVWKCLLPTPCTRYTSPVPSGMMWRKLTGNTTVAEREMRVQKMMALLNPAMIQLLQVARQDPGVYHLMKRYLESLGMGYDVVAILGPEPQPASPGMSVMQGLLQGMAQTGGTDGGENSG